MQAEQGGKTTNSEVNSVNSIKNMSASRTGLYIGRAFFGLVVNMSSR